MLVQVDKNRAYKAAKAQLDYIHRKRKENVDLLIECRMDSREFWRKIFFWMKPLTKEEMLEKLKNEAGGDMIFSDYQWLTMEYGNQAYTCEKVIDACNATNLDSITLNDRDFAHLNL